MRSQILALLACGLAGVLACRPAAAQTNSEVQQIPNGSAPHVSLSLHDALALALTNNLDYQSSLADERAAEGQVVQARASLMPSLSGGYSYVHTQTAESFEFPTPAGFQKILFSSTDINNVNGTLQYALYNGGANVAAVGQASANLAASQSDVAAQRATIIRDTTSAYFQLIEATRSAAVADEAVSVAGDDLKTANEQYQAGTSAKVDVLRTEVSLADARVNAIKAHNDAALANAQLANILNINLSSIVNPTDTLEMTAPTYTLDALLSSAQARPELASAHDAVAIADDAVKLARAGVLPTVALQIQEASSKPNFFNVPQPQLTETLAVTWQLWDGGLSRGKVQQASADVDKAKIQLQSLDNGVDLEVREAFFNYTAALAQVDAARDAQTAAQENYRVNAIRFRAGVGTSLELADALLSETQAEDQYISSLADLRISLVTLQRAAGLIPTGT
ncbi:MAG TPA: TolC family protein [Candidatus Acidoferrales bacterium]|nr:TolC family protein [Candidatus Acidoferrales bacterium]